MYQRHSRSQNFRTVLKVDLDLGNYERFLDLTLHKDNNITTGKIYQVCTPPQTFSPCPVQLPDSVCPPQQPEKWVPRPREVDTSATRHTSGYGADWWQMERGTHGAAGRRR